MDRILDGALPADVSAEKTLLGCVLLENDTYYEIASSIQPDDFSLDSHRRIFLRMSELMEAEQSADLVTLMRVLIDRKELQAVGGAAYLADLTTSLPRRISPKDYLRIVKEKSTLRKLMLACHSASARCSDQSEPSAAILADLQQGIESALIGNEPDAAVSEFVVSALDGYHAERKLDRSPGLSYGIASLDEFTGGMRQGEVTVVGARSGVGKTSLAAQTLAANAQIGLPCVLFSLEMTRAQILRRLFSIVSRVRYRHIVNPWESSIEEAERITAAAGQIAEWPLRIYDQEDLTLSKILALGKVCIRRHKAKLLIVDYAQEVDAPGKDERTKLILVCRRLARLVKHEDSSLMLLSQLVKTGREFYGKPPVVSDLVESGKLENVAHCVVLLHRGWDEDRRRIADDAELIVPKQRRGGTGVLRAKFNPVTATFEDENGIAHRGDYWYQKEN